MRSTPPLATVNLLRWCRECGCYVKIDTGHYCPDTIERRRALQRHGPARSQRRADQQRYHNGINRAAARARRSS